MTKPTKTVAVIDAYINSPALFCFNQLLSQFPKYRFTYHNPALMGTKTLALNDNTIGYIILGSASHVTQKLEWQQNLADFMLSELDRQIPILGICFGHQLMAHALGAKVDFEFADQTKFLGSRFIKFPQASMRFKKDETIRVTVSHRQTVQTLPDCLQEIAYSDVLRNEVIKHKTLPFVGIQGHPEASFDFCNNDARISNEKELKQVQEDGYRFVKNFLSTHISSSLV